MSGFFVFLVLVVYEVTKYRVRYGLKGDIFQTVAMNLIVLHLERWFLGGIALSGLMALINFFNENNDDRYSDDV